MSEDREPLTGPELVRWWAETGERELRQLLYWKWDPIGVNDSFPWAVDEYDGYAPQILSALRDMKTDASRRCAGRSKVTAVWKCRGWLVRASAIVVL